jgi:hypothetical protein
MSTNPKMLESIVNAGIALAYSNKGAGIAGVWAEFLRQHVRFVKGPNAEVKTWGVDGKAMWINEEFTAPLTPAEVQFLIAHETMHIALDHVEMNRVVGANTPEKAHILNIAQDAVINQALVDDEIGTMPKGGVLFSEFVKAGYSGSRESIALYQWLIKNQSKAPKPPPPGGQGDALKGCSPQGMPGDEPAPGEGEGGDKPAPGQGAGDAPGEGSGEAEGTGAGQSETNRARARMRAERARATLREASHRAGVGTAIGELLAPVPTRATVRQVIRAGFERASQTARNRVLPSYSRAGRRSVDEAIMTPGKVGTESFVAFVGDVSGSMTEAAKKTLIGMIASVAREFPETRVYLVTHTSDVTWKGWMREGGDVKKAQDAVAFSGGTDFKPAYEAVRDAGRKFDVLVHFTDGFNMGEWPECPARQLVVGLWGSGDGMTKSPAGTKVIPVASVEGDA